MKSLSKNAKEERRETESKLATFQDSPEKNINNNINTDKMNNK